MDIDQYCYLPINDFNKSRQANGTDCDIIFIK